MTALNNICSQFRSDLQTAKGTLFLIKDLRGLFRQTVTPEQATEEIKRALESREQTFLDLIRTQVYGHKASPYLKLLRAAGCEFGDLQNHIHASGLEKTLQRLAGEGVYLTAEEFKGKKEVVRRGLSFRILPKDLELQDSSQAAILIQSSGTTNRPQRYALSLDRIARQALLTSLLFSAHDLFSRVHAIYDASLPSSGGIRYLLAFAKLGVTVDRWFAPKVPMGAWPEARYHQLMAYLIVQGARWFGPGSPWPEFLDSREAGRVVDWIVSSNRAGKSCCVRTTASNAVRVANAALGTGQSLDTTKFIVSGEPLTKAKRELIERAGGGTISHYGSGGLHHVGSGCANSPHIDDVHVAQHLLAVIQHPLPLGLDEPNIFPFLFTTLSSLSSSLHLNVENGDYGFIEERRCGCAIERAGLTLHIHQIRSFEKLTSEAMNYYYGDLYELLETTLPSEFGGSPGDYQLVEEEDSDGQTRLNLSVHPSLGDLDHEKLLGRVRAGLANGSRGNRFMTGVWQNAGTLRIKRQIPHASPRGKILPLDLLRRDTPGR